MGKLNKKTIKNCKAQFFTMSAILLIILVFVSFEIYTFLSENKSIKTRVMSMDSFLSSTEENFERQMYIFGFRTLFLAEQKITSSGYYINDIDNFFEEAFFNGTVNGISETILQGATYSNMTDAINEKARKINVNITMTFPDLIISQSDPWNVNVTLISNFSMRDKGGLAKWEKKQTITVLIPITYFEDPFYTINSNAKISRKFNQTIYEGNYVSGSNVTNLRDHVAQGYYTNNTDAPSFLNRLEGNFSVDINGVESFVNINEFENQGLSVNTAETLIDHLYFNPSYTSTDSGVSGMQSWFKIDDGHKGKYQLP